MRTDATLSTRWSTGDKGVTVVLAIADRRWSRVFTEQELADMNTYSGEFATTVLLWSQVVQARIVRARYRERQGWLDRNDVASDAAVWEIERRVIVGLFPDAANFVLPYARELAGEPGNVFDVGMTGNG